MRWYEMSVVIISVVIITNNGCIHIHVEQASPTHGCNAVSNPINTNINTWTNITLTSKADRSEKKTTTRNSKHTHWHLTSRARLWKPRARFGHLGRDLGSNDKTYGKQKGAKKGQPFFWTQCKTISNQKQGQNRNNKGTPPQTLPSTEFPKIGGTIP